jgi:hypothetical protein
MLVLAANKPIKYITASFSSEPTREQFSYPFASRCEMKEHKSISHLLMITNLEKVSRRRDSNSDLPEGSPTLYQLLHRIDR